MSTADWYFEIEQHGYIQGVRVTERLAREATPFQRLEVLRTDVLGKVLVLDDALQTSERDEFMYHEMLVHVPLMSHPNPRRALIIGGGDGGALRHMLMHPVERPIQVEIDEAVVRACKEHVPAVSNGAFDDPRAELIIGDGIEYMRNHPGGLDVIIVDSTDPVGPAVELFQSPFYLNCASALADDGLMVAQSSSPLYMADELRSQVSNLRQVFPIVRTYMGLVMGYPGVAWSYTIGSKRYDPLQATVESIARRIAASQITTRYYTPELHHAAFVLPRFIADIVA